MAFQRLFKEISLNLGELWKVYCDNQQTIRLVVGEGERINTRLRHVDVHNLWLRQEHSKKAFEVTYLSTNEMPADGLTKNLPRQKFEHFRALLNLQDTQIRVRKQFVQDVGDRAEGVFLWAFLVTRSLRDGLTNGDTLQDLRKRLVALPTDLERLFRHMLDAVDSLYHEKMARIFLIALWATIIPLDLLIYAYHNEEEDDEDYAIRRPVKRIAPDELDDIKEQTKRRINAWSSGLLEVQHLKVEFLHRSVRDFLHTGEMNNYLAGKLSSKFDAALSISRAFVAMAKSPLGDNESDYSRRWNGLIHFVYLAVRFAAQAEPSNQMKTLKLMDALENAMETLSEAGLFPSELCEVPPRLTVRMLILHSELTWYVEIKLKDSTYFGDFREPPLFLLLATGTWIEAGKYGHSFDGLGAFAEMLDVLLRHGQDPNDTRTDSIKETTFWTEISRFTSGFQPAVDNRIASICLAHGADANATRPEGGLTAFALYLFACFSGKTWDDQTDNYLRGLGDFLEAGANLGALLGVSEWEMLVGKLFRKEDYLKFENAFTGSFVTVCEAYCRMLSDATNLSFLDYRNYPYLYASDVDVTNLIEVDRQRRFAFLSEVTKRLVLKADLNAKMAKQLEAAIKQTFPEPVADPLVENRAETNYQKPARARGRKDTQAQLHVLGSKLRCPLCNHSEGEGAELDVRSPQDDAIDLPVSEDSKGPTRVDEFTSQGPNEILDIQKTQAPEHESLKEWFQSWLPQRLPTPMRTGLRRTIDGSKEGVNIPIRPSPGRAPSLWSVD
ncbi:hypothetical protein QBC46DRAFT_358696 [Diplogelasinospora grovesii]|uniref:DUF7791 domain-containing protein n=1 Tax=Diplogelasinospora grovesii TaxID=303347 RepID=A0AAN6MYK4_9PEZI|nr:hypothetical protein QBC46DRAFT_358696 [Diplogelasinospora grovesii]